MSMDEQREQHYQETWERRDFCTENFGLSLAGGYNREKETTKLNSETGKTHQVTTASPYKLQEISVSIRLHFTIKKSNLWRFYTAKALNSKRTLRIRTLQLSSPPDLYNQCTNFWPELSFKGNRCPEMIIILFLHQLSTALPFAHSMTLFA